jgi:hypothetical protein
LGCSVWIVGLISVSKGTEVIARFSFGKGEDQMAVVAAAAAGVDGGGVTVVASLPSFVSASRREEYLGTTVMLPIRGRTGFGKIKGGGRSGHGDG